MAGNPPDPEGGFSIHVMDQLHQAAQHVPSQPQGRGRGRGRGPRGQGRGRPMAPPGFPPSYQGTPYQGPPPAMDAFPPLGSQHNANTASNNLSPQVMQPSPYQTQPQHRAPNHQRQVDPREFFDRARGRGDSRQRQTSNRQFHSPQPGRQMQMQPHDDFRRPPAQHGSLYQHNAAPTANSWAGFSSPGHDLRHQVMAQSDYLNDLQMQARAQYQLKQEEQIMKETFRKRLEGFFQQTLAGKYPGMDMSEVRLKCYGSLNNGFGLADCDMDLLLALPKGYTLKGKLMTPGDADIEVAARTPVVAGDEASANVAAPEDAWEKFELGWLLEDALLDAEIGARLLTNTRVPIMKVCETPGDDLLDKMRKYSKESRRPPSPKLPASETSLAKYPPVLHLTALEIALSDLEDSDSAAQISIPASPQRVNGASVEFSGDHGIKCDINFSNFVALCNTRLLREYCAYDHRVAEVGVFIKTWAKRRDINTPYWGTLSSYGYVLMVLHYLMNVVSPPVIPNLQHLAREDDAWKDPAEIELFEGKYDIRFWTDRDKIASFKSTALKNRESTGHLLRGFFWYYSARDGFNYKFDVISIRTDGGRLRKQDKGWTEAKWSEHNKNVRQRYLMAIEDPFETEHNVARVVGHNGIVAIRDEFRRAWDIISRIGTHNALTENLLELVENRGDLLRKDQEHHRQKMRQMRQDAEARERELRKAPVQQDGDVQETGMFNENDLSSSLPTSMRSSRRRPSNQLLTRDVGTFQDKPRHSRHGRQRAVKAESEEESDAGNEADDERAGQVELARDSAVDQSKGIEPHDLPGATGKDYEEDPEPFCSPADILIKNGLDEHGNSVAWDMSTQDGRWLHWRDTKIRKGEWRGVVRQPGWEILDKMCPYDPRRPRPHNVQEYRAAHELMFVWHPPMPMSQAAGITSTERAMAAAIPKPFLASNLPNTRRQSTPASSFHRRISSNAEESVGLHIPWDRTTRGGRWLTSRDALIRLGTFKRPKGGLYGQLNKHFPYDATMSRSQLDKYNEELRAHYKDTIRAVNARNGSNEISPGPQQDNDTESFVTNPFGSSEPTESSVIQRVNEADLFRNIHLQSVTQQSPPRSEWAVDSHLIAVSESGHRTSQAATDEMPDSRFIRSRRLAFFAQKESEPDQPDDIAIEHDTDTIRALMKEAGINIDNSALAHKDPSITNLFKPADLSGKLRLDEEFRKEWPYGKRPWTKRMRPRQLPQTDGPVSLTESSERRASEPVAEVAGETSISKPAVKEVKDELQESLEPQVPDTLFPEVDNEERPRDEDPSIMPIPRNYGFEFDVRQLRDLAVIKEGGNGCARDGYEFEVEQDYELGGSGEMAWRQSSGKRFSSNVNENEVYEYGKGDEEGLLAELPGL